VTPNEYVMLSAHLDSWDGSSGATDNGTGTVVMMEAMRILRGGAAAPAPHDPRRALERRGAGAQRSRAFAADHPEIIEGLQALYNQDDGTGRIDRITMEGLVGPGAYFREWLRRIPAELTAGVTLADPGTPGRGGTDNASFTCSGAPGFGLNSRGWDYGTYTWHTDRDTFDKIVPEELRRNATLIAMLAYFASETPDRLPRTKAELPVDARSGRQPTWPACGAPQRSYPAEATRGARPARRVRRSGARGGAGRRRPPSPRGRRGRAGGDAPRRQLGPPGRRRPFLPPRPPLRGRRRARIGLGEPTVARGGSSVRLHFGYAGARVTVQPAPDRQPGARLGLLLGVGNADVTDPDTGDLLDSDNGAVSSPSRATVGPSSTASPRARSCPGATRRAFA
jgi:hypothetical protein